MEGPMLLAAVVVLFAALGALAVAFGAESRDGFGLAWTDRDRSDR